MLRFCRQFFERNNKRTQKLIRRMRIPGESNPLSKPQDIERGVLYVVSTPIGNIKDFSVRGLDVLKNVDYIACYNLNNTRLLMDVIDMPSRGRLIQVPYENAPATKRLIGLLEAGHSMALVSNAGTPMIGDPTGLLVHSVQRAKYRVTSVPGPCSIIAALTVSGIDFSSCGFRFIGYVSHIASIRKKQLRDVLLHGQSGVCVMFDTPPRILATLKEIATIAPNRRVSVVHEVTKINEAVHCQEALTLYRFYERSNMAEQKIHGEIVLCVDSFVECTGITTTHYGTFNELEVLKQFEILTKSGQSKESALLISATNLNLPIHVVKKVIENLTNTPQIGNEPTAKSTSANVGIGAHTERKTWTNDTEVQARDELYRSVQTREKISASEKKRIGSYRRRRGRTALREQVLLLKYKRTMQKR